MLKLCLSSLLFFSFATCQLNTLWLSWVTNWQRVSFWSNEKQCAREHSSQSKQIHPQAHQTRWKITQLIINGPKDWQFGIIMFGSGFCYPQCTISLVGLENQGVEAVNLHTYNIKDQEAFKNFILELQRNPDTQLKLNYFVLEEKERVIKYTLDFCPTEQKDCFHGGLKEYQEDGSLFYIDQRLSDGLVRVFEAFYSPNGQQLYPEFTTPIEYEPVEHLSGFVLV